MGQGLSTPHTPVTRPIPRTGVQRFEILLERAKRNGNKKEEAGAYLKLGKAFEENKQFEKAIECFNNALKIAKKQNDTKQEENAYQGLASAYAANNEPDVAQEYLKKAMEAEIIGCYNKDPSKFKNEDVIKKLSTSDFNEGLSIIIGELGNERPSHTPESAHIQNTEDKTSRTEYTHFEKVFSDPSKFKKRIDDYMHERGQEGDKKEIAAYLNLGYSLLLLGEHKKSAECYNELLKFASQIEDKKMEMNAYVGLGRAFSNMGDFESSEKYFLKTLKMSKQHDDNGLLKETHIMLGNVYYTAGKFENALESYLEAQKILVDFGATKDDTNPYIITIIQAREMSVGHGKMKDEANISFMLGDTFQQLKQGEKAIKSYQRAIGISKVLKDKEMQELAQQRLGISYLTSASVCRKDRDYERAIQFYKKALAIFDETKPDYLFLREKALKGLGVALFRLGRTKEAIESVREARKLADNDTDNVGISHEKKDSRSQKPSFPQITAELLNITEETCNFTDAERLPTEDLASLEKHFEEFSASNIYAVPASSEEPLTENDIKTMTENVKSLARKNLLGPSNEDSSSENDVKFVSADEQIYNLARDDLLKNKSTKIPAIEMQDLLSSYMGSVGQISCGEIRGTCFLVTDKVVITNYHVYRMFMDERQKKPALQLPITVTFDYFYHKQAENCVCVDVDERGDRLSACESGSLDYKFLSLRESEGLRGRVPLGPLVSGRRLEEGLVIILGHPAGSEMFEETCVVVRSWEERLEHRHEKLRATPDVHIANIDSLHDLREKHRGRLAYDTTLFCGSSGSPVFTLNGDIVAMHTQGYTLNFRDGKCSLMEFGVQFSAICKDMRTHCDIDVVREFFPNNDSEEYVEDMETMNSFQTTRNIEDMEIDEQNN